MRQLLLASSHLVSTKSSQFSRADCHIHIYFSHEKKKPVHLLHLDSFPKESQETDVVSIVVTPCVSSFSAPLEFVAIVHYVTPSVSSFSECLEFFLVFSDF